MSNQKPYYLTTAIYYANAKLHVGHSWELLGADVMARTQRLLGRDVYFSTGMDEHSLNVERAAKSKGLDTKTYCDEMAQDAKSVMESLKISFDRFIQTSERAHQVSVQALINQIKEKGDIYSSRYEGYYCESCEAFYTEKDLTEIEGELTCPIHGSKAQWLSEDNWFFKLSSYQERLLKHIADYPEFIQPESRKNEVLRFIESGLVDFSVSRSGSTWGIQIPWDPNQVIYVWIDALTNYLSAIGYEQNTPETGAQFKRYWPADAHVIGKDISRFHCVYWPAMLMSAGLPLPKKIVVHGWLNFKGEKLSKSRGNIVSNEEMVGKYGVDPLRWYILSSNHFLGDGNFSEEKLIEVCNAELSNDIGNCLNRTLGMMWKYHAGKTGPIQRVEGDFSKAPLDRELIIESNSLKDKTERLLEAWDFLGFCKTLVQYSNTLNKYIDETKPWALAKDPTQANRLHEVLSQVHEGLRILALLLRPVLVEGPKKIYSQLGYGELEGVSWGEAAWGLGPNGLQGGVSLLKAEPVFPKLELLIEKAVKEESAEKNKSLTPQKEKKVENEKSEVDYDQFAGLELRVGTVLECTELEKSDKLLKLSIDFGSFGVRTVVSGIKKFYTPESLLSKKIVAILNLKRRKIFGIESEAMVLAVSSSDGEQLQVLEAPRGFSNGDRVS